MKTITQITIESEQISRENILKLVNDSVSDLLYYDRKEDEDVKRGDIEKAIQSEIITFDEMVAQFRESLAKGLSE